MSGKLPYRDRTQAGEVLARSLDRYRGRPGVVVVALPRGGVPVGYQVAASLKAPLDILVVRKLGVPGREELAFGAIANGGVKVLSTDLIKEFRLPEPVIEVITEREEREIQRQEQQFRGDRPFPVLEGRTVILVDDGLATGATMLAGIRALRERKPARLIVAVPVAASGTCEELRGEADEIVCAATPEPFRSVSAWYENFPQTSDEEVRVLLARANPSPL
jgi:putative phosphoribosyl transferase